MEQRSGRHRRRRAHADGRLPGRLRVARGERPRRGGDQGRGRARGHCSRRDVDKVIMGCVLPAGQGQAPARQAALKAGPADVASAARPSTRCAARRWKRRCSRTTRCSPAPRDVIVAGGMESMTNAPYLLPKARAGYRMGHQQVIDHMFLDGLEDAYDKGRLMGTFAEDCAAKYEFTREEQDAVRDDARCRARSPPTTTARSRGRSRRSRCRAGKGDVVIDKRRAAGEGARRTRSRR